MRPFTAVVFVMLSIPSFSVATPLDAQLVLPDQQIVVNPRWKYTVCGDENDIVNITSIEVSPDPPKPGKDLTVKVKATTSEAIEEGAYAEVTVKLGLIKLLTKQFDLCEEARNANASVQCPVASGPYEIEHTVALPREIPRAKFNVHIDSFTADDQNLFCLNLWADFTLRFPHLW